MLTSGTILDLHQKFPFAICAVQLIDRRHQTDWFQKSKVKKHFDVRRGIN